MSNAESYASTILSADTTGQLHLGFGDTVVEQLASTEGEVDDWCLDRDRWDPLTPVPQADAPEPVKLDWD